MHKIDRIPTARALADECRVVHDWFAGWRWEQYRGDELVDECLASFETEEECRADVQRRHMRDREQPARDSQAAQEDLARLAA